MKRGNIENWSDVSGCRNLLFFAQLINELLFDYSIPSNRISTLNSHYLCRDAMTTIETIEENGVPEGTLKPIMEELYRSLSKDITFSTRNENPLKYFLKLQSNGSYSPTQRPEDLNFEDSKKVIHALYQRYFETGWYTKALVEDVKKWVLSNKEEDLQNLFRQVKAWLTQLINGGYSAKYISYQTHRMFFPKHRNVDDINKIEEFLNLFDFRKSKYQVVFVVNKQHQQFLKTIDDLELLDSLEAKGTSHYETKFLSKKPKERFVVFEREACDPFTAVDFSRRMISDNVSIYRLFDHNYRFDTSDLKCGVYDEEGFFYHVDEETSAVQRTKTPNKERIEEKISDVGEAINAAVRRHNVSEFFSLMNAVRAHSLSLDSDSEQNQLLDLWSIFETILDISNKHTSDRIQQVCTYLVPILKRKYVYSLFSQLANDIRNYSDDSYTNIVQGANGEFEAIKKLCEFVLLDSRKSERDTFLSACTDFPLLKERIEYYHAQLETPRKIYEFADKHSERVKWQVMRIYRNRNLIIHNGEAAPYLKLLVENLHSYVDDFLDYVIQIMSKGYNHTTMCQELFVKECEWREHFENRKAVLTPELIEEMLML
jgi:hypothetical protein